jgi:RNA polymerase sigma-70 factor (ECF subfamily)
VSEAVQRSDDPRVSGPVIETLEIARPTTGLSGAVPVVANVERETALAYDAFAHRLRSFAISATRDGELADDIVQEAFLRLVVELKAGRKPDNVGGWLFRVAGNLIISRGRRKSIADRARSLLVRHDTHPSPEQDALAHERDRTLATALSKLPADARVALLLAARGMGATEIGIAIRKSPGATRTYICRARVKLRDELAALGYEGDR